MSEMEAEKKFQRQNNNNNDKNYDAIIKIIR